MLFNFALERAITKNKEIHEGLKLTGLHQLLVYVDDNYLGENKIATKKNISPLLDACKEVCMEGNA